MYLFQVKVPGESRGRSDYCKTATAIPVDRAFRPISEGGWQLVK